MKKSWTSEYPINTFLVDSSAHLGLMGALTAIQETAWTHAETLGFGMKEMEEKGIFWVLVRQTLRMQKWPVLGHKLAVETWVRRPAGLYALRELSLRDATTGEDIGQCMTTWLALSRQTKTICPIDDLMKWNEICDDRTHGFDTEKIVVQKDLRKVAAFDVRNSDLDINMHVNNTKYAQWILDALPHDIQRQKHLTEYAVNFLSETKKDDRVLVEEGSAGGTNAHGYRGVRESDGKVLFTARLTWA